MLTLKTKLDRLFEWGHEVGDLERTNDNVTRAISQRLGTVVSSTLIADARSGARTELPADVAAALCTEFGINSAYLDSGSTEEEVLLLDLRIQLFTLIRDRGLQHLLFRSHKLDVHDLRHLIEFLREQNPPVDARAARPAGA